MAENGKAVDTTSIAIIPVKEQDTIDVSGDDIRIDEDELKDVCKKPIARFWHEYKDCVYGPDDRKYIFIDNGAKVLAVAHLDTVVDPKDKFNFNTYTRDKVRIIKCPTLDDRLGVYIITKLMPKLLGGGWADILLTDHEESGSTTAKEFLDEHGAREYNWIVEFDRRGSGLSHDDDAVLYSYMTGGDIAQFRLALQNAGFKKLGRGSFTDITAMQDMKCKAFNVGVGYFNNHVTKAYMKPVLTENAVSNFVNFYMKNYHTKFVHKKVTYARSTRIVRPTTAPYRQDPLYASHTDAIALTGKGVGGVYDKGDIVRFREKRYEGEVDKIYYIDAANLMRSGAITYNLSGVAGGWASDKVCESALERAIDVCMYCITKHDETYMYYDDSGPYYLCKMCADMIWDGMLMCEECQTMFAPGGDNGDFGVVCNDCSSLYTIQMGDVVMFTLAEKNNEAHFVPFLVVRYFNPGQSDRVILWDGMYKYGDTTQGFDPKLLFAIERGVTPERFLEDYAELGAW